MGNVADEENACADGVHCEETLTSEDIYKGKVFSVTRDTARLQNDNVVLREVVHHPGGAGVVALDEAGKVALVRQFRYAQQREMWEIPAGKLEKGEPPAHAARRELEEEVGCTADHWRDFGRLAPTPAYCTEVIYLYLATGLHKSRQNLDDDEFLTVEWVPLAEAVRMVMDGRIIDAKSVAGLLRAAARPGEPPIKK